MDAKRRWCIKGNMTQRGAVLPFHKAPCRWEPWHRVTNPGRPSKKDKHPGLTSGVLHYFQAALNGRKSPCRSLGLTRRAMCLRDTLWITDGLSRYVTCDFNNNLSSSSCLRSSSAPGLMKSLGVSEDLPVRDLFYVRHWNPGNHCVIWNTGVEAGIR